MNRIYVFLLLVSLMSGGCAQRSLPSFALAQPEQSNTITHPDKMEKAGGTIVEFVGALPPRFMVEVDYGVRGVWPLVGVSLDNEQAPVIQGSCFSMEEYAFASNPWRIPAPMECFVLGNKKELMDKKYAFVLVNKDGGVWMASPIGSVIGYEYTIIDDNKSNGVYYDYRKFEDDREYAISLMKEIGKTIPVIEKAYHKRLASFGVKFVGSAVQEISIKEGDPKWEEFRTRLLDEMNSGLELPDGEVVVSYLSQDEMKKLLSRNPRLTPWQRFLSGLQLPLGTPEVMAIGFASSVINSGIAGFLDDRWNVCTARGMCQRRDMSEQLAFMYHLYQKEYMKNMGDMR